MAGRFTSRRMYAAPLSLASLNIAFLVALSVQHE